MSERWLSWDKGDVGRQGKRGGEETGGTSWAQKFGEKRGFSVGVVSLFECLL